MPERYLDAIVKFLSDREYQPLKPRQVARRLGVQDEQYAAFREAVKRLKDEGRVALGPKSTLSLPPIRDTIVGVYRANPRGFGFVVPTEPNAHGDLFIPPGESGDALTGDTVVARVLPRGKREGKAIYNGRIVEILERGHNRFVGQLHYAQSAGGAAGVPGGVWFVVPQGRVMNSPVVIDDVGPAAKEGRKVFVEIVRYGEAGDLPHGVIVEDLGEPGPADVETLGIIREHGLPEAFDEEVLADARAAIEGFEPLSLRERVPEGRVRAPSQRPAVRKGGGALTPAPLPAGEGFAPDGREDLTDLTIVTIDPDDARDYDDAISIQRDGRTWKLGVHIADVAHFVRPGRPLNEQARARGNSVYFPRKVLPMLPEILSNGVCSLQEGQIRYVKSAFIDYDEDGNVIGTSFANAFIRSAKRLTYRQAQGILDGQTGGYEGRVVELVKDMNELARRIEARRRASGMLHLDLPEVELVLSDDGKVIDAVPADASYTHTIIEMFMVEANEAVARLLDSRKVAFLRRIHPDSQVEDDKHLATFLRACGHKLPAKLTRHEMQSIIESVRGRPESYAVNLALLKTLETAEYSPMSIGHYALASTCYCHFTSPIRRYPDLTIHRLLDEQLRGRAGRGSAPLPLDGGGWPAGPGEGEPLSPRERGRGEGKPGRARAQGDVPSPALLRPSFAKATEGFAGHPLPEAEGWAELVALGEHCSFTERRAQRAEDDLRTILVLEVLQQHVGDVFEGVVTGITNFGLFVQFTRYLVEGLLKLENLGDDWWEVDARHGWVSGQRSGRRIRMGDALSVRLLAVDVPRRQLDLVLERQATPKAAKAKKKDKGGAKRKRKQGRGSKGSR